MFGNACLPQGSARLEALVSQSAPRTYLCLFPRRQDSAQLHSHPNQLLQPFGSFPLCGKTGDAALLCNCDRLAPPAADAVPPARTRPAARACPSQMPARAPPRAPPQHQRGHEPVLLVAVTKLPVMSLCGWCRHAPAAHFPEVYSCHPAVAATVWPPPTATNTTLSPTGVHVPHLAQRNRVRCADRPPPPSRLTSLAVKAHRRHPPGHRLVLLIRPSSVSAAVWNAPHATISTASPPNSARCPFGSPQPRPAARARAARRRASGEPTGGVARSFAEPATAPNEEEAVLADGSAAITPGSHGHHLGLPTIRRCASRDQTAPAFFCLLVVSAALPALLGCIPCCPLLSAQPAPIPGTKCVPEQGPTTLRTPALGRVSTIPCNLALPWPRAPPRQRPGPGPTGGSPPCASSSARAPESPKHPAKCSLAGQPLHERAGASSLGRGRAKKRREASCADIATMPAGDVFSSDSAAQRPLPALAAAGPPRRRPIRGGPRLPGAKQEDSRSTAAEKHTKKDALTLLEHPGHVICYTVHFHLSPRYLR